MRSGRGATFIYQKRTVSYAVARAVIVEVMKESLSSGTNKNKIPSLGSWHLEAQRTSEKKRVLMVMVIPITKLWTQPGRGDLTGKMVR